MLWVFKELYLKIGCNSTKVCFLLWWTILGDQIWQTTNALKSIALQRLHRIEEALELVDSVAQAEPSDETVLQMLSNIYRDCNKPEFIPKIYENALKKNESEDLYT